MPSTRSGPVNTLEEVLLCHCLEPGEEERKIIAKRMADGRGWAWCGAAWFESSVAWIVRLRLATTIEVKCC
jgi:hypothetical protein